MKAMPQPTEPRTFSLNFEGLGAVNGQAANKAAGEVAVASVEGIEMRDNPNYKAPDVVDAPAPVIDPNPIV